MKNIRGICLLEEILIVLMCLETHALICMYTHVSLHMYKIIHMHACTHTIVFTCTHHIFAHVHMQTHTHKRHSGIFS